MKNKIRVGSKSEYVIEVNDQGDTISFDINDPELVLKFDNAFYQIQGIQKEIESKEQELKEKEDRKLDGVLTANEREALEFINKKFQDMRDAMDVFLGKGACQKIFGDRNYVNMYEDLIEQLEPHLEKIGINAQRRKDEIKSKYGEQEEDTI